MLLGGFGAVAMRMQFGGTQYAKVILNALWGLPPALDMDYEKRVQTAIREMVRAGLVESAHDLSDGGLAVALAECCFGADGIGARCRSRFRPAARIAAVSRRPVAHSGFDSESRAQCLQIARKTWCRSGRRSALQSKESCRFATGLKR